MKRMIDISFSLIALAIASPVCLAISVAVLLTSGRPIFFTQERVGRGFRTFRLFKFRTMRVGQPGLDVTAASDPRITPVGRLLRRTKLDELPQLWNVLRGDMSLVGPRPELPRYVLMFYQRYQNLLTVRPGLTDPATLAFLNEETLLAGSADPASLYMHQLLPAKLTLAESYVRDQSIATDFSILLATGRKLLRW